MKIATLPKSGTHLFRNLIDYLAEDRGTVIELDHIVMPNRPDFINSLTPSIVTTRDPRGYFFSLLNWFNKQTSAFLSGEMRPEEATRYFEPHKAAAWAKMHNDERLFALIYDTKSSLLVVSSRQSYDHILAAKSKPNCYVARFEDYSPAKSAAEFGPDTIEEYRRIFSHLGIPLTADYVRTMLMSTFGHSITWSDTPGDAWRMNVNASIQNAIVKLYEDVIDAFGYEQKRAPLPSGNHREFAVGRLAKVAAAE